MVNTSAFWVSFFNDLQHIGTDNVVFKFLFVYTAYDIRLTTNDRLDCIYLLIAVYFVYFFYAFFNFIRKWTKENVLMSSDFTILEGIEETVTFN